MKLPGPSSLSRRVAGWWTTYGIFVWSGAVIATAILGFIGFSQHHVTGQRDVWDRAYLTVQLVALEGGTPEPPVPWEIEVARVAAPALAAIGLVGIVTLLLRALTHRDWKLRFIEGHTIVCGLGERGSALVTDLLTETDDRPRRGNVVVVQRGANSEDVEACRDLGAIILEADATDPAVLKHAGVERAGELVALCASDGINGEIAAHAVEAARGREDNPLRVLVQIGDPEFRKLLEERAESPRWRKEHGDGAELKVINVFDHLADQMLDWPADQPFPAAHRSEQSLLILGLGTVGHSVLRRALERWQRAHPDGPRLNVLIADQAAGAKIEQLRVHYRELVGRDLAKDAEIEIWQKDIAGYEFDAGAYRRGRDFSRIFVCFNNDHLALTSTLTLRRFHEATPIAVRMSRNGKGLASFLGESEDDEVRGFGVDRACTASLARSF